MRTSIGIPRQRSASRVLTIGSFDGLHLGHLALVHQTIAFARSGGHQATLLSFHPHPRTFFQPQQAPARVLPWRDRLLRLQGLGMDAVILLRFQQSLAQLSAEAFVQEVLCRQLQMRALVVGEDFRFGRKRAGDVALLRALAPSLGFSVHPIPIVESGGHRSSSSALREALQAGQMHQVRALLQAPYLLSGRVSYGQQLGRTLGFPTLNLRMPEDLAARGIFAVWVHGLGPSPLPGVASLGRRPTVEDQGRLLLEVYLFDWQGDAYGRCVRVEMVQHLRGEQKFDDLSLMTQQMHRDLEAARAVLSATPSLHAA